MRTSIRWVLGFLIVLTLVLVWVVMMPARAEQTFNWQPNAQSSFASDVPDLTPDTITSTCRFETVRIESIPEKQYVCLYQGGGFRYGVASISSAILPSVAFVVGFSNQSQLYVVDGMLQFKFTEIPLSKNLLITKTSWNGSSKQSYLIRDFLSQLEYVNNPLERYRGSFRYTQKNMEPILVNEKGGIVDTWAIGASPNGRWVAAEVPGKGFVRIDTTTHDMRWYSVEGYDHSYEQHEVQFSVTNNGRYIATAGQGVPPVVTEIDGGCGWFEKFFADDWRSYMMKSPCPKTELATSVSRLVGSINSMTRPMLDSGGGELLVNVLAMPVGSNHLERQWVRVLAAGYNPHYLEYLAMGDSYSSGEGDTRYTLASGFVGNYKSGTDHTGETGWLREMCHLSPRSYPYLLRDTFAIPEFKMRSVACSGAKTIDMTGDNEGYMGQDAGYDDGRKKEGRLALRIDADALKLDALNNTFLPGRNIQTEFVKKYRPHIVTITAGGNDLGFGDILKACGSKAGEFCDEAKGGGATYKLGNDIHDQFTKLKKVYREILDSNPNTELFVIGYPSFISDTALVPCGLDGGFLNHEEKVMINESIHYFNQVIEAAARAAGVAYIDIENSLYGGRICEPGESYVTSVQDIFGDKLKSPFGVDSMLQTAFHPNHRGHEKIAAQIKKALGGTFHDAGYFHGRDDSVTAPSLPAYFANAKPAEAVANRIRTDMAPSISIHNVSFKVVTPLFTFRPGSVVNATLHSDPTHLGTVLVGLQGSVAESFVIPDSVPPGYHTLYLQGVSLTGEPIELYQTILVGSSNPNDRDGDGIADTIDVCPFMDPAGVDVDHDGIDDMCDPLMNGTTIPAAISSTTRGMGVAAQQVLSVVTQKILASAPLTHGVERQLSSELFAPRMYKAEASPTLTSSARGVDITLILFTIMLGVGTIGAILFIKFYKLFQQKYITEDSDDEQAFAPAELED